MREPNVIVQGMKWCAWLCGMLAAGCAAELGSGLEGEAHVSDDESVASANQPLLGGWATGPFKWSQGLAARRLEPLSSHVCVLTRMSGKFEGLGEAVRVVHDGTNWFLEGNSQQSGVSGEATCFPRAAFADCTRPDGCPSSTRLWSAVDVEPWCRFDCDLREAEIATGSEFTFLTAMAGKMWGAGEWASVVQSPSVNTPSFLQANICADHSNLTAAARAIGTPRTSELALFVARNGGRGDLNAVPEFVARSNGSVVMAPASKAMCAFTTIQGGFRGGGEAVQIRAEMVDGLERWVLRTQDGGSHDIRAGARCFARYQL